MSMRIISLNTVPSVPKEMRNRLWSVLILCQGSQRVVMHPINAASVVVFFFWSRESDEFE